MSKLSGLSDKDIEPLLLDDTPTLNKKSNRGNTIKHLTKRKSRSIIRSVTNRKDDKMANNKNTNSKRSALTSIAWLIEAAFRVFVGWVLLSNFNNIVSTAAALYALGTAGLIVVTHFVLAHK